MVLTARQTNESILIPDYLNNLWFVPPDDLLPMHYLPSYTPGDGVLLVKEFVWIEDI